MSVGHVFSALTGLAGVILAVSYARDIWLFFSDRARFEARSWNWSQIYSREDPEPHDAPWGPIAKLLIGYPLTLAVIGFVFLELWDGVP